MFTLRLLKIKIHSRRVFIFKRCLPIFAFLLASMMLVWPAFVEHKEKFSVAVPTAESIQGGDVDMENVRFFSKDKRNNPMNIVAVSVQEIDPEKKILKLNDPKATYKTADNILLTSVSAYGLAFQNEKYLYFEKEILSTTDTGYEAVSEKVTYDYDKNTISSDFPVFIKGPSGMLRGEGFFITDKGEKLNFKGNTKTLLFETEKKIPEVKELTFDKQESYFKKNKNSVMVTSEDGLIIDQMGKTITAKKNAHVYREKDHVKAEKIILTYKKDEYNKNQVVKAEAYQNAQVFSQNKTAKAEEMVLYKEKQDMLMNLNLVKNYYKDAILESMQQVIVLNKKALVKEDEYLILADKMYVFYKNISKNQSQIDRVIALGNVQASNGTQRIEGKYGIYNPITKMVDVYDNVRLKQGKSVLNGDWANLNLETGVSSLKSKEQQPQRIKGSLIADDFEQEREGK
ncbi:MAG: LPS export ABC transporter periplasmic protein LptC [Alphaproteobacteria bacterium]|nr:LPS export ABC transporter periplasmic protein LptC [Alphaproteobacteria bacterium]